MDVATLKKYLDDPKAASEWLRGLGASQPARCHAGLMRIATSGMTLDLLASLVAEWERHLPTCADTDMAIKNFEDFILAARSPLAVGTFFQRGPGVVGALTGVFSTSQHFAELLIADREGFDLLRLTQGSPTPRQRMTDTIVSEVKLLQHDDSILAALRRYKRREAMRIAYGDIVQDHALEVVARQISYLADALVEAALAIALRNTIEKRGRPIARDGSQATVVALALGKLGGAELNYSSDIDLLFLYQGEGNTDARRPITNAEFFGHVVREVVRLLTETTELGSVYRVDLRLRPDGARGPLVPSFESALQYYDFRGRTWERQAMIKARPIAGDIALGERFLASLSPWIWRRYLSFADISGIKQLKRKIERRSRQIDERDVKTGRGGIRDIEFVIQFLQLLNGADLPEVQTGNTLRAIDRLERVGCLTDMEATLLGNHYRFLRKIEHRLQIMFDLQTHTIPDSEEELRKLAIRTGYADSERGPALGSFMTDLREKTNLNRKILDHLLHDAFPDAEEVREEVDLVLEPQPSEEMIQAVLSRHGFKDTRNAYRNLMSLAEENIRFLSPRRCRHFLAAIAPGLLAEIGRTPDPDATLVALDQVSASLGGKAVLWELFSSSPASLKLYVDLCASSPYLCNILTSHPGMIDGLMDSLVQQHLPSRALLKRLLQKLCRSAEDVDPILHTFKSDQMLRVGVRDILGRDDVRLITAALSDIAEVCLSEVARREYGKLVRRFGEPILSDERRQGHVCQMAIVGMGKFGGREMNYHSDLDVIFLYEGDGKTVGGGRDGSTSNQHFFSELGSRIIKMVGQLGPFGRLYEIDARLRPSGKSGSLATSLDEFDRYFGDGGGQLWERQALCKARVVHATSDMTRRTDGAIRRAAFAHRWRRKDAVEIREMRARLESTVDRANIKRGAGGIVDIEFLVQMLQLKHGRSTKPICRPGTFEAIDALHQAGILSADDHQRLAAGYRLLRTVEGRLRLIGDTAGDAIPTDETEAWKLTRLMGRDEPEQLIDDVNATRCAIRERFDDLFEQEEKRKSRS